MWIPCFSFLLLNLVAWERDTTDNKSTLNRGLTLHQQNRGTNPYKTHKQILPTRNLTHLDSWQTVYTLTSFCRRPLRYSGLSILPLLLLPPQHLPYFNNPLHHPPPPAPQVPQTQFLELHQSPMCHNRAMRMWGW